MYDAQFQFLLYFEVISEISSFPPYLKPTLILVKVREVISVLLSSAAIGKYSLTDRWEDYHDSVLAKDYPEMNSTLDRLTNRLRLSSVCSSVYPGCYSFLVQHSTIYAM